MFGTDRLTATHIHTLMVLTAMQDADRHFRSSLGFSILPKDTLTRRPGESKQRPSDNKMLNFSNITTETFPP